MKKRFLCVLLVLSMCIGLLPMTVSAESIKLNHIDITIELPKGGDAFDPSYIPVITSFIGDGIDLLAGGAGIMYAYWDGDVNLDEYSIPYFRNGGTYSARLKLILPQGYLANGTTAFTGETVAMPETFSATVNGIAATVTRNTSVSCPEIALSLKLEGEAISETEKAALSAENIEHMQTRREIKASRTWADAAKADFTILPEKVHVLNYVTESEGYKQEEMGRDITTLIYDSDLAARGAYVIPYKQALREVWVGDGVDILKFYQNMIANMGKVGGGTPFCEAKGTLFISDSSASTLKTKIGHALYYTPPFTIKVYSGNDVYAAQKAGASAAKEFCTDHQYTEQVRSADRVYTFTTCQASELYYYSCAICGKCEYNPNHVEYDLTMTEAEREGMILNAGVNVYDTEIPSDSAYIGVNAAGQHVWWLSCNTCGKSYKVDMQNMTDRDRVVAGQYEMSFEEYRASALADFKLREEQILNSTITQPDTFTLGRKSNAYMSEWAQGDVNLALNDNLIDTAVFGGDYTQNITRLQFCSLAVKLAEELIGHAITPANGNTFTDTNDEYVLKAYAAGITSGTSDTTFDPNGTLTRQQMATFIYRALRYAENNSDYKYTIYNSKLGNYTDSWSVQSWAQDAMAFMNALDLIKGNTDTTLNPDGLCTIEQAIAVAGRSLYAHQQGWYQVEPHTYAVDRYGDKYGNGYTRISHYNYNILPGTYIWVTGRRFNMRYQYDFAGNRIEDGELPCINPYTNQIMNIPYEDVIPVRD